MVEFNRIKHLRDTKGLTQDQVADYLSLSRPSYALIEQGLKDITVTQLYKLASLLDIPVSDIASGLGDKQAVVNYAKFKELVLACIRQGADVDGKITKTKLAKLVYLADFNWFYRKHLSMTGAMYRHISQGPVADEYFRAIDEMYNEQMIAIEPKGTALMISALESLNPSRLSEDEMALITEICDKWKGRPTSEIVSFTHAQNPWKNSSAGGLIPYETILSEPSNHLF